MPLQALASLLEARKGGVWFLAEHADPKAIASQAKKAGYAAFHVDGKNIGRKEQFLNHVATALHFPKSFGHNWDALEEALMDIEGDGDGFLIYYDQIEGLLGEHPDQFETLVEILRDAVASWKEDGTPMIVLLSGGAKAPKGVTRLKEGAGE